MKLESLEKDHFYHVYNRGINGSNIFSNDENKQCFLRLLKKHLEDKVSQFAYSLLQNHFHLVLRIEADPKEVTQSFSNFFNSYAKAYNKSRARTGSLFEKHFKRIKVENELYLRQLIIYVNLNPEIHFGIPFESYNYSSYNEVLKIDTAFLNKAKILELFGGKENFIATHK